ncbi:MAG: hypothetical protein N2053_13290, partial [Chitinispirillaceae bacterium]|nr:hypothetical protein [Chitinispirillaceae bacterium]
MPNNSNIIFSEVIRRLIFIIIFVEITTGYARQAKCVGKFSLKNIPLPTSMDIYSIMTNFYKEKEISVILTVIPSFNVSELLKEEAKIIRRDGNEILLRCKKASLEKIASISGVIHCSVSRKPFLLMDSVRSQCR